MQVARIILPVLLAMVAAWGKEAGISGKRILVIESYHAQYEWDREYSRAIRERFGRRNKVSFFQMDTKRLPAGEHGRRAEAAWRAYLAAKPDLVFLGDDAALKLLGPRLVQENTPVVYLGINSNPRYYFASPPRNMTGVLERPLFKRCISLIKELIPEAKRVLVLLDSDLTSKIIMKEVFEDLPTQTVSQIQVDVELIDSYKVWQDTVRKSDPAYDFIVAGLYQTLKDAKGSPVDSEEVIRWTSANTKKPLFGFWSFSIGHEKAIGGLVLDAHEIGSMAADMGVEILQGTPPDQLPPKFENKGLFLFSKSELAKWKISLSEEIRLKAHYVP